MCIKLIILRISHYINRITFIYFSQVMQMSKPRRTPIGDKNIVGAKVERLRKEKGIRQKELVATLQSRGMDICETSMSRLEGQTRLVQDFEVVILAQVLGVTAQWLLTQENEPS